MGFEAITQKNEASEKFTDPGPKKTKFRDEKKIGYCHIFQMNFSFQAPQVLVRRTLVKKLSACKLFQLK